MRLLRKTKVKIFLTVLIVYLFYISPDFFGDTTNRYIVLTKAIVDDKTFRIDKNFRYVRDIAPFQGHYYVGAGPGPAFLAAPFYTALKPALAKIAETRYAGLTENIINAWLIIFLGVLPGALIAVILYDILSRFALSEKEKLLSVFSLSFGTIVFYYSTKFTPHVLGAFLLLYAFYVLFCFRDTSRKILFFLAGLAMGMAVLMEYSLAIGSFALFVYGLMNFRKDKIANYAFLLLGLFITVCLYLYYHYTCFGNAFIPATHYSRMLGRLSIGLPQPRFIFELTFGTYRGLFLYMPILLIPVYCVFRFFLNPDKKFIKEMIVITVFVSSVFYTLLMVANKWWPWGGAFGPRHVVCFIPFLMVAMAFAYKKIRYEIILWLAVISIFINWCGVQYGDADNVFTDMGLFVFQGLNSGLAQWAYGFTITYIRKLNVITHFSPLVGFVVLLFLVYLIWRKEIEGFLRARLCKENYGKM